jgi:translation initiation factor 2B subunit (eIF-2B alpha/beta/delta family)
MISLSNVQMVEQNLGILFVILDDADKFKMVLEKDQYRFYVTHMMNYLDCFDKDQVSLDILAKVIQSLLRIFDHIVKNSMAEKSVFIG